MIKLIHASLLDPPLAGQAYYLAWSDDDPNRALLSIKVATEWAKTMEFELEIIRPSKSPPLTQRQRNERSGRVGWVSDRVVRECVEMLSNLENKECNI